MPPRPRWSHAAQDLWDDMVVQLLAELGRDRLHLRLPPLSLRRAAVQLNVTYAQLINAAAWHERRFGKPVEWQHPVPPIPAWQVKRDRYPGESEEVYRWHTGGKLYKKRNPEPREIRAIREERERRLALVPARLAEELGREIFPYAVDGGTKLIVDALMSKFEIRKKEK